MHGPYTIMYKIRRKKKVVSSKTNKIPPKNPVVPFASVALAQEIYPSPPLRLLLPREARNKHRRVTAQSDVLTEIQSETRQDTKSH